MATAGIPGRSAGWRGSEADTATRAGAAGTGQVVDILGKGVDWRATAAVAAGILDKGVGWLADAVAAAACAHTQKLAREMNDN